LLAGLGVAGGGDGGWSGEGCPPLPAACMAAVPAAPPCSLRCLSAYRRPEATSCPL